VIGFCDPYGSAVTGAPEAVNSLPHQGPTARRPGDPGLGHDRRGGPAVATVKTHLNRIYAKTGVMDRAGAVDYARRCALTRA
jgi:hypothetical protein